MNFFDVQFRYLVDDPIACARRIYAHFDLELSDSVVDRMQKFITDHPRDKHGVHSYRLEDAGLDAAEIEERFSSYVRRYDIPTRRADAHR